MAFGLWGAGDPQAPEGFKDWGEAVSKAVAQTLFDDVLGSDQSSVVIPDISQDFAKLRLDVVARSTHDANPLRWGLVGVRINADTGDERHRTHRIQVTGTTVTGGTTLATTVHFMAAPDQQAPSTQWGAGWVEFPFYNRTGHSHSGPFAGGAQPGDPTAQWHHRSGTWRYVSGNQHITRLDVFMIGEGIVQAGSRVTLYGIGTAH